MKISLLSSCSLMLQLGLNQTKRLTYSQVQGQDTSEKTSGKLYLFNTSYWKNGKLEDNVTLEVLTCLQLLIMRKLTRYINLFLCDYLVEYILLLQLNISLVFNIYAFSLNKKEVGGKCQYICTKTKQKNTKQWMHSRDYITNGYLLQNDWFRL